MVTCPSCGTGLPPSAVSSALQAARCPTCAALVDLGGPGSKLVPREERRAALAVPIPEKWKVDEGPRALTARWGWFSWSAVIMVPFTLFWNGILVGMAFGVTEGGQHPERLLIGLAVPHVWVGLGLAYGTLASFVNSTTVRAADGALTVRKGPLPWLGNRHLAVDELKQLFVVEQRGNRGRVSYDVCAVLRDGRKQALVTGLDSADKARFLETRLEQLLDIQDQPVEGELRKS